MSQNERLLILHMVAEKKITADEAYELIQALDASAIEPIPPLNPTRPSSSFGFSGLSTFIEGLVDRVTSRISDSVGPRHEFSTELTGRFDGAVIPLTMVTGNGQIDLQTWDQLDCKVVVTTKVSGFSEEEARIRAQNAYEISLTPTGFNLKTADDHVGGIVVGVTVHLPAEHRYRVDARTGNGRIEVSGIAMTRCSASTGNGRIQVDGGSADEMKARTGNGSIHINAEAAYLTAESGNGSVSVSPQGMRSQRLDLSTGNGSIKVHSNLLPPDAGKRVEAHTVMSRIQVTVPNLKIEEESRGVGNRRVVAQSQGFESAAQQVTILAKTSTGSVTIE